MTDINTTAYLIKPNVETTRYFTPSDPSIEIWEELNKKEYITDHNADIGVIDNSLTNITQRVSTNENDISDLKTRMTTSETNISNLDSRVSTNENDISDLQEAISGLEPGTKWEGMYQPLYNSSYADVWFNYNIATLRLWFLSGDTWRTDINNKDGDIQINGNISNITLPGTIKRINQDGSTREIIRKIYYYLVAPNGTDRITLSNLKSITINPDVYLINFNLTGAPNLRYFNLFEGLQEIYLTGTRTDETWPQDLDLINLRIPASVKKCSLTNIILGDLRFEGYLPLQGLSGGAGGLELTLNNAMICGTLYCVREIKTLSISNKENNRAPRVLYVPLSFLSKISQNSLGDQENIATSTLYLVQPLLSADVSPSTLPNVLHFKRIINETNTTFTTAGSNLQADIWIGN